MKSCAIVGAGLSGLVAARTLEDAGIRVTILEREEKIGGRMRTDLLDGGVFDHGAQFFTVRDDRFEKMVQDWVSAGVAEVWTHGFADASGEKHEDGYPRYKGKNGMTAVAEHLARGLDIKTGSEVTRVNAGPRGWGVSAGELTHPADALIVTVPAPAALALMDRSGIPLPNNARTALEGLDRCTE